LQIELVFASSTLVFRIVHCIPRVQ